MHDTYSFTEPTWVTQGKLWISSSVDFIQNQMTGDWRSPTRPVREREDLICNVGLLSALEKYLQTKSSNSF